MALDLVELATLRAQAEWSMLEKRGDANAWRRAWRQRGRWERRWASAWYDRFTKTQRQIDLEQTIKTAQSMWRPASLRFKKAKGEPSTEELATVITVQLSQEAFTKSAGAMYVELALAEGEDAGQFSLDALGLHKTFEWAGIRDFEANPFAIRGSKVIQGIYGEHMKQLARLVLEKTNPAEPKTIGQLTKEIKAAWPDVTRKHALTIARTESAHVWETTNWNALTLNGVREVEWLVASGPSIGPPKSYEVCELCLEKAANSPYVMDDVEEIPPLHPRCRCTVIQRYDPEWLPPAEPWTGAATKMEIFA